MRKAVIQKFMVKLAVLRKWSQQQLSKALSLATTTNISLETIILIVEG